MINLRIVRLRNLIALIAIVLLMYGCKSRSAVSVFTNKDSMYAQNMQYTKLAKIIKKNDVEVLITATYINPSEPFTLNNTTQKFILAAYYTNENSNSGVFTLNGKNYIKKELINQKDDLYRSIPLMNRWAQYYLYTFKEIKEDKLIIKFSDKTLGIKEIVFDKY
ncbi:MAG: hypothetical protein U9Q33_06685 [Campylobacterota bacterium]|nr:hypothetical protein [Campylobacterota bacterium]